MKRKTARKKKDKLKVNLPRIFFYIGVFSFAILFVSFIFRPQQAFCANAVSCIKDLTGKYESNQKSGVFMGKTVVVPDEIAASNQLPVLGTETGGQKHIHVDLTRQRLYAFDGGNLVYNFPVSTGKWHPTPTGDFTIWSKLRYTRMTGGDPSDGTFYDLPNVPFVMFFAGENADRGQGFSIHGAYWHNNFGHPMSHGCVNMRIEDAEKIYSWTMPAIGDGNITYATSDNPGTTITIAGEAPED